MNERSLVNRHVLVEGRMICSIVGYSESPAVKAKKKTKLRKAPSASSKKSPDALETKTGIARTATPHRAIEMRFLKKHPEAFDRFIGEWVVLQGTSIVAHGANAASVAAEARSVGIDVPYIFRVVPKLKDNQGSLGL
jgi:hypothetical protein